ncbi:MAG: general secretion pathway protein GspB [Elusimicrobia bacterium]|nr:general secretion pathway protein GspB [Elusimicrobiota bacterium]
MSVVSATPATPASPAAPDFSVELPRDPMLSPADRLELAQAEALRRSGGRRAKRPSQRVRRRRELTGAERVELQGIIAIKGGGGRAIVNGQTVAAGDTIAGVKVLKITQSEVVFSYRNKRFIKSVGK